MAGHSKHFDPRQVRTQVRRTDQMDRWQKWVQVMTAAAVLLVVTICVAVFVPVVKRHQAMVAQKAEILQKIQEENNRTVVLTNQLHLLREDRVYIERIARDVLDYGRKGETIFRFREDQE